MGNIIVSASTWRANAGGYDPDDDWSRDSYEGGIEKVWAREKRGNEGDFSYRYADETWQGNLKAERGDTVYAVIACYTTGDTFGSDGGNTYILDVFDADNKEDAYDLADTAENVKEYGFEFKGSSYRTPWYGYFERLDSMQVYPLVVER